MPKWILNIRILIAVKGGSHTRKGNTRVDFLEIFHTFMQTQKSLWLWCNTAFLYLPYLEVSGRNNHVYFLNFNLKFSSPNLILSEFPFAGLKFQGAMLERAPPALLICQILFPGHTQRTETKSKSSQGSWCLPPPPPLDFCCYLFLIYSSKFFLNLNWLLYNFIVFLIYISHPLSDILWQVRRQISCLFCCLFLVFFYFLFLCFSSYF